MKIAKKRDKNRMSKYIITIFKILESTPESQSCKENKNSIFVFPIPMTDHLQWPISIKAYDLLLLLSLGHDLVT